jgi:hypothetical protein
MDKADRRVLPVGCRRNPCPHRDGIIKKKIKKGISFLNNFHLKENYQ